MLSAGASWFGIKGLGFRGLVEFRVWGLGLRVWSLELQGLEFQCLGFRVWVLGGVGVKRLWVPDVGI